MENVVKGIGEDLFVDEDLWCKSSIVVDADEDTAMDLYLIGVLGCKIFSCFCFWSVDVQDLADIRSWICQWVIGLPWIDGDMVVICYRLMMELEEERVEYGDSLADEDLHVSYQAKIASLEARLKATILIQTQNESIRHGWLY